MLVERYGERAIRGVRNGDLSVVPPGVPVVYDRPWGETRDVESLYAHWRAASGLVADWQLLLAGRLDADNVAQAVGRGAARTASTSRAVSRAPRASRITNACGASSPRPRRRHEHGRAGARRPARARTAWATSAASAGASCPRR